MRPVALLFVVGVGGVPLAAGFIRLRTPSFVRSSPRTSAAIEVEDPVCIVEDGADVDINCLFADLDHRDAGDTLDLVEDEADVAKALAAMQQAIAHESLYNIAEDETLLGRADEDAADVAATATVQSSWDSADQDANPVWSATEALSEVQDNPPSAPKDPLEAYHAIAFDNEIAVCDKPGIGVMPSHEHVDLIPGTNVPAYLETPDIQYVDEPNCIGCGLCSSLAPATFMVEDVTGRGNGRVFEQGGTSRLVLEEARDSCPTRCIHTVSFEELKALEEIRDRDDWRGRDWAGAKGRPDDNLRSGVLNSHCYGTHKRAGSQLDATDGIAAVVDGTTGGDCAEADHSCPKAGCFNCPAYFYALSSHEIEKSGDELSVDGRGQNPVYQARAVEQAAIRAVWRGKLECQIEHASADATSVDL